MNLVSPSSPFKVSLGRAWTGEISLISNLSGSVHFTRVMLVWSLARNSGLIHFHSAQ